MYYTVGYSYVRLFDEDTACKKKKQTNEYDKQKVTWFATRSNLEIYFSASSTRARHLAVHSRTYTFVFP
jgi:hypothetical protein